MEGGGPVFQSLARRRSPAMKFDREDLEGDVSEGERGEMTPQPRTRRRSAAAHWTART